MNLFDKIELYHGSKSGIKGKIRPCSRSDCDFGSAFYLGDNPKQPKGLISAKTFVNSVFYVVNLDLSGLKTYHFTDPLLWALYIAYNRGYIYDCPSSLQKIFDNIKDNDVIIGVIADDAMVVVLDEFFNNTLTDLALIEALKYVDLGNQYVLKSQKACDNVSIISQGPLTIKERKQYNYENQERKYSMNTVLNKIRMKYIRKGKYFFEILGEYQ